LLESVPPDVVTLSLPVVAPAGTVVLISEPEMSKIIRNPRPKLTPSAGENFDLA
jgi:hypothetical protein